MKRSLSGLLVLWGVAGIPATGQQETVAPAPPEYGLPIIHQGKVIGAIGVSGVESTEDAQVATAGLKVLERP